MDDGSTVLDFDCEEGLSGGVTQGFEGCEGEGVFVFSWEWDGLVGRLIGWGKGDTHWKWKSGLNNVWELVLIIAKLTSVFPAILLLYAGGKSLNYCFIYLYTIRGPSNLEQVAHIWTCRTLRIPPK